MRIRYDMVSCYIVRPAANAGFEFLQLHREKQDFMGGTWQTVYGTSEEGETPMVAVLREVREETGLTPIELFLLDPVSVFYIAPHDTLWHCVQFCAVVDAKAAVTLNSEHDDFRWLAAARAEAEFMWHDDRRAVRQVIGEILGNGIAKPHMRVWPTSSQRV